MSVYNDILDAVVTGIQALSLVASGQVVKRKLPKAQEELDTLPLICVAPADEKPRTKQISFGDTQVTYPVEVGIVRANNGDQLTGLDASADWLQKIRQRFGSPTLVGVTAVFDTDPGQGKPVHRELIADNYDLASATLLFFTSESRE